MKWGPCLIAALVLLAIGTADGFSGMMPLSKLGRSVSLNGPPRPPSQVPVSNLPMITGAEDFSPRPSGSGNRDRFPGRPR